MPPVVMLVDDDAMLANVVSIGLEQAAFDVVHCDSADDALDWLRHQRPDVMVLDVDLQSRMDGYQLCNLVQNGGWTGDYTFPAFNFTVPILMLTTKGNTEDMLTGYHSGADDYMPKPYNLPLLVARLQALLRRTKSPELATDKIQIRSMTIYEDDERIVVGRTPLDLTPTEYELLLYLARHPGKIRSRDDILHDVWGYEACGTTRAIDTCIRRIRSKLVGTDCHDLIITKHRVGYYLAN